MNILLARDKFWQWDEPDTTNPAGFSRKHEFGRLILEANLEIPGLGGENIKPAIQGYIDMPLAAAYPLWHFWKTDDGTNRVSVVNISMLLHFDLTSLKAIVGRN